MYYNVAIQDTRSGNIHVISNIHAYNLGSAIAYALVEMVENGGYKLTNLKVIEYRCFCVKDVED